MCDREIKVVGLGFALLRQDNGQQTTDNGRAAAGSKLKAHCSQLTATPSAERQRSLPIANSPFYTFSTNFSPLPFVVSRQSAKCRRSRQQPSRLFFFNYCCYVFYGE